MFHSASSCTFSLHLPLSLYHHTTGCEQPTLSPLSRDTLSSPSVQPLIVIDLHMIFPITARAPSNAPFRSRENKHLQFISVVCRFARHIVISADCFFCPFFDFREKCAKLSRKCMMRSIVLLLLLNDVISDLVASRS